MTKNLSFSGGGKRNAQRPAAVKPPAATAVAFIRARTEEIGSFAIIE
jgi:hypothetical protein